MPAERDTLGEIRREFLWRFAKRWPSADDRHWAAARLEELKELSVRDMSESLLYTWNELVPNVEALAAEHSVLEPLAEALAASAAPLAATNARTLRAQDEMLDALGAADVWPLVIKGAAMRAFSRYPQAMNDLDLVTRDLDQTWEVLDVATQLGYPLGRIKVVRLAARVRGVVRYHGYTNLYRRDGGGTAVQGDWDLGRVRTLDLHIARFYGCGDAVLATDLFARAARKPVAGRPALLPSPEDMVLVEIVHMIRHGTVTSRVMNRVAELLIAAPELDTAYVAAEVKRNDAQIAAFAIVSAIAAAVEPAAPAAQRLLSHLRVHQRWRRALAAHLTQQRSVEKYGAGSFRSVAAQATYLFDSYRHQFGAVAPVARTGAAFARMFRDRKFYPRAYERWSERRTGWLSARTPAVMLVRIEATAWPIALLRSPAENAERVGRDALLLDRGRKTEALLTPIGTFVSTAYDGRVPANVAAEVTKRTSALREQSPQSTPAPDVPTTDAKPARVQ